MHNLKNLNLKSYIVKKYNSDGTFSRYLLPCAVQYLTKQYISTKVKYNFYNKKYPVTMGIIDFETILNKFIESNKKYFDKFHFIILCTFGTLFAVSFFIFMLGLRSINLFLYFNI